MKLVIIESPFSGHTQQHIDYARKALRDSLMKGEAPLASHLLYTQSGVLNDAIKGQREMGIAAGLAWYRHAAACIVYADLGISEGMKLGIARAKSLNVPVIYRNILP